MALVIKEPLKNKNNDEPSKLACSTWVKVFFFKHYWSLPGQWLSRKGSLLPSLIPESTLSVFGEPGTSRKVSSNLYLPTAALSRPTK